MIKFSDFDLSQLNNPCLDCELHHPDDPDCECVPGCKERKAYDELFREIIQ
jgi:hypothetical protein